MDLAELKSYRKWLINSPQEVIQSVKMVGGWQRVFPSSLPRWASKVRNYFNETPKSLSRFDEALSAKWLKRAEKWIQRPSAPPPPGKPPRPMVHPAQPIIEEFIEFNKELLDFGKHKELLAAKMALSGDVYIDYSTKRIWYQMSPGGAIYHYGSQPTSPGAEAAWATAKTQHFVPVFKLVSPDGTGGSQECIITNPVIAPVLLPTGTWVYLRSSVIADVNEPVDVSNRIVTDTVLQGSYNYSETVEVGLAEHELRDVKPHSADPIFYCNPFPVTTSLALRRFPVDDNNRDILAFQE